MNVNSRIDFTDRTGGHSPQPAEVSWHALAHECWLLLIHGYNNDQPTAEKAYRGFAETQRKLFASVVGDDYCPGWHRIEVMWQGFANWSKASASFYPMAIPNARATGQMLAGALVDAAAGRRRRVHVVAHSLGCRVTLELIRSLNQRRSIGAHDVRVERVVFFAAAVPVFGLEDDPPLGLRNALLDEGVELSSMYSLSDGVLMSAFPTGQTAGGEGFFPKALGRDVWPIGLQARMEQHDNAPAGHGDYWGAPWTKRDECARRAGRNAATFLRWTTSTERESLGGRQPGSRAMEAVEPVERRTLPVRT